MSSLRSAPQGQVLKSQLFLENSCRATQGMTDLEKVTPDRCPERIVTGSAPHKTLPFPQPSQPPWPLERHHALGMSVSYPKLRRPLTVHAIAVPLLSYFLAFKCTYLHHALVPTQRGKQDSGLTEVLTSTRQTLRKDHRPWLCGNTQKGKTQDKQF